MFTAKNNMKKFVFIFMMVFLFQSCSWQECFVITNQCTSDITIEYEIEHPKNGFGIFDNRPSIYNTTKSGDINWNEVSEPNDADTSISSVKIILPPNNALIIGRISNDNYKKHDQYFINGRTFNLKKLTIKKGTTTIHITPNNFDHYFKKKQGIIGLKIKEN